MARHNITSMNGGTEWMSNADCKQTPGIDFFSFDERGISLARSICRDCPVKDTCLEFAVTNNIEHGVWGGMDETERRLYKRSLNFILKQEIANE